MEIVTPNHVSSPRVKFTITCNFGITSVDPQVSPADYDCSGADEQTFLYSAIVSLLPAAGSHTIAYYWLRYDDTKSSSFSTTASPFDTSVTLQSDSFSLMKSAVMSKSAYWEELVITSPHSPASPDQLKRIVYKFC